MKINGLRLDVVRELASAGSVREAVVLGTSLGWNVIVKTGLNERVLMTQRGEVRRFGKLDTVAALLRENGIGHFRVEAADFEKSQRALPMCAPAVQAKNARIG